ncbi:AI-2E family transporter [Deinococcus gobiensis]|uniref:Permease n=1 Tax=Deinococcus gobiensis (strain DSM 21396 / JCM 16679 / CGMCC 1.7299 / I-0) TaxID=745776 RepID=H8H045_DEIGI|nr:AI-2E family transporter [Deinococcus gobiensis]AFD27097.1 hypothetical protein DGo_PA0211 [Deinococcus gobiensis I-0]
MTAPPPAPPFAALRRLWTWPLFQLAVVLLLLWGLLRVMGEVRAVLLSVAVAYLIAHLTNPVLRWLSARRVPRPLGITLLFLALLGLLAALSPLIVTTAREVQSLAAQAPQLLDRLNAELRSLSAHSPLLAGAQTQLSDWITQNAHTLPARLSRSAGELLSPRGALVSGVLGAFGLLGHAFITLVISIYMMAIYPQIGPFLLRLLPLRYQPGALELSGHVGRAVGGYFRGQITVALILGALLAAGLTLLGVPSGLAVGFLAALLNIVPYLGVVMSLIPALLLALPLGGLKVALVGLLFLAVNQLEGHVISPRVVSHSTNLSPLGVLLAILFGVELFGILGAIVAVPFVALVKALMEAYYYPSAGYRAGAGAGGPTATGEGRTVVASAAPPSAAGPGQPRA